MHSSRARALLRRLAAIGAAFVVASCGGGGGGDAPALRSDTEPGVASVAAAPIAGANVLQIRVEKSGQANLINTPFVTVRVCLPGSATCIDVDRVVVDTGSSGLRINGSALGGLALPAVTDNLQNVAQCHAFASGRTWGAVRRADVRMGGEVAAGVSIQVIDDAATPKPLGQCAPDIGSSLGGNGILGVGFTTEDCPECTTNASNGTYFRCAGATCNSIALAAASQVSNPSASFAANGNGVMIALPAVPSGGAASVTGWLVLGIGTQSNNQLGSAGIYRPVLRPTLGYVFTTTYKGVAYDASFIDSGSNGYFFNDAFTECGDFYCPDGSPLSLTAVNTAAAPPLTSASIDFILDSVTAIRSDAAAAHIAGSIGFANTFDWGLPFFFGRTVFTARAGAATPAGAGPYWAY
ncbi:DUF3443 family protein [Ramlibacter tataouinensis]|uniref:DUF3443 family protein n=1 Tax=Ramlibacter tataouinensis TaxID=94132 RepID=UPI0022F3AA63|nr:DUF3443 family protein [Ramlibacter tataouinensis]WBY01701.1 DUF3443 family protein [Ramlibacter tataouinensis]